MALVHKLENLTLESEIRHTETTCTYSIIQQENGLYLQIDTYGSSARKIRGKKSQSIRFSPEAIKQLKEILTANFE